MSQIFTFTPGGTEAMYYKTGGNYPKAITGIIFLILFLPFRLSAQQGLPLPEAGKEYEWPTVDSMELYRSIQDGMASSIQNQDSAILMLKSGVEQSLRYGYHDALFQGCFYLGVLYIFRGEYDVAYRWLWQGLAYSEKSSRTFVSICRTLNNIGNISYFRGDYRQAAECYFKAIPLAENAIAADPGIANPLVRIYTSTAGALLQMREYPRALYYLDKAEGLAEEMNLIVNLPAVYVQKAALYARMNRMDTAWTYNQKGLSLAKRFHIEEVRFTALQNMGDIQRQNQNPEEGVRYLNAALKLKGNINVYYKAGALASLGECYLLMNDLAKAEKYLKLAFVKATALGVRQHMLHIHNQLSLLYVRSKDYHRAYEHTQAAYALNDSLLNKDKTEVVNHLEVKYRLAENEKDIAQKQILINEQERRLGLKNIWILGTVSGITLLAALLFGFVRNYRQRQKLYTEQLRNVQREQEIALLQAMMQGEEKERIRFAHELHDGISSQLSAMKLHLDIIKTRNPDLPVQQELDQISRMLTETSGDVRKTAHNLMPDGLIRQGLEEATRTFCELACKGDRLKIEVQAYGNLDELEDGLALSVYRTIQELVHNIVKHAGATQAIVLLNSRDTKLYVTVEDNGVGMARNPAEVRGIGLKSLQQRIRSMKGQMIIESGQGTGTTIYIELPLKSGSNIAPARSSEAENPIA